MPIVMKNGTAIKLNEFMPLTICWQTALRLLPCANKLKTAESATAYAIGKRRIIIKKKVPRRINIAQL
jgi:hypothetical protein